MFDEPCVFEDWLERSPRQDIDRVTAKRKRPDERRRQEQVSEMIQPNDENFHIGASLTKFPRSEPGPHTLG